MDNGWKYRLESLMRGAENEIISKLKTHGWKTEVVEEVSRGDYVIIETSRGESKHRMALLFSAGTANQIFKDLEDKVEHVFINGSIGANDLKSFAYGLKNPVTSINDFQLKLLEWNQESTNGLFSSFNTDTDSLDPDISLDVEDSKYNRIQSENPIQGVWIHLRQLESVTLAKKNISRRAKSEKVSLTDEALSSKSEGLAFALRNASDYFKFAEGSNISQRIINLYYGTLSFAFAEMLSSPFGPITLSEIEDSTKQGHGLYTIDGKSDKLEDLIIGVIKNGFYSNYMAFLKNDISEYPFKKAKKFDDLKADDLFWLSLEELFSKLPDIGDLFINIFESKPGWIIPTFDNEANSFNYSSTEKAQRTYSKLIDRSGRWSIEDVLKINAPLSEISELKSGTTHKYFRALVDHKGHKYFWSSLKTYSSPYVDQALIVPAFKSVDQYRAINLAVLYALSIVVRYRPSLWRRVQEGDLDYMAVFIEAYLDSIERILPQEYLSQITGQKVVAKQPGSLF